MKSLLTSPLLPVIPLLLASCSGLGVRGSDYRLYDARAGEEVELDAIVADLARRDVVFLGEEHDNDVGHDLQLWTIRQLHRLRPDLVISLEQFEADVQSEVDLFLGGAIDEATFLERSRPWPNYARHYRPVVEFAREHHLPVIAANVPRPLAARVARRGLDSVAHEPDAPWFTWTDEPEYRRLFDEAMGQMGGMGGGHVQELDLFTAQCIKDEKMAQSIAGILASGGAKPPLVVHLCGKFHSDFGLGTISRLLRYRPGTDVAIVSTQSDEALRRELSPKERRVADYLWVVRPQPE